MTDLIAQIVAYLRGMWRFRWWALLGSWLLCMVGYMWVYSLPNMFESTTSVYVDTQSALKEAIRGLGSSSDVREEIQKKLSEMVSTPKLREVARDTDLDLRATTPLELEKLVEKLRRTIEIKSGRGQALYSITYRDNDAVMAQRVVKAMLSDFVGDSLRDSSKGTNDALQFLESEIRLYQARLLNAEQALAEFKKRNIGLMPGSGGDYYTRLETATSQLSKLQSSYRLKIRTRDALRRQLEGEEPTFNLVPEVGTSSFVGTSSYDAQIDQYQRILAQQRLNLTEKHPDVMATVETIKTLEQQRDKELAERTVVTPDRPAFNPLDQNPVYQTMKIQLSNVEIELVELETAVGQQSRTVNNLRKLVDTVPEVEAQLSRLNRDYEVTKTYHDNLLERYESARLGEAADQQSDDIKFQVINPPVLPIDPIGPNRPIMLTGILMASLFFGIAVAFLLDQLKPVFSTRHDLAKKTGLPVLGTIGVVLMPRQKVMMGMQTLVFAIGLMALIGMYFGAVALEDRFVELVNTLQGRGQA